ncbi:MAG: hypothetical protein EXS10_08105 [Phycisphaerales bacterium]|nr:hypothetical protein [Phycisphaerales bacterium]
MGACGVLVWVMPRMDAFLRAGGSWNRLVSYENIELRLLSDGTKAALGEGLSITHILVPRRQEYSVTVRKFARRGIRIDGSSARVILRVTKAFPGVQQPRTRRRPLPFQRVD